MNKCKTCGYEAEQGVECVGCMVARLEAEGNEIAEQHDIAVEERYAEDPDGLPSTATEAAAWEAHVESRCHD